MGMNELNFEEFINGIETLKPDAVFLDRHWFCYHLWFRTAADRNAFQYTSRSLSNLFEMFEKLLEMKVNVIVVKRITAWFS